MSPIRRLAVLASVLMAGCATTTDGPGLITPGTPFAPQEEAVTEEVAEEPVLRGERPSGMEGAIEVYLRRLDSTEADFDDVAGGMSVSRTTFGTRIPLGRLQTGGVHLDLAWSEYDYDFDRSTARIGGERPVDRSHTASVGADWFGRLNDRWTGLIMVRVLSAMESGAHLENSLSASVLAGGLYRVSDRFSGGGGMLVYSRIEDSPVALPIFLLNWRITDRLGVETRDGIEPSYQLDRESGLSAFLLARYDTNRFRLSSHNVVPDGVAEHSRIRLGLGLRWRLTDGWNMVATVGTSLAQSLRLDDSRGREIFDEDLGRSLDLGLTLTYSF